jgi:hypothetical protein
VSEIKETDLAWAAGFFDGEGYIGLKHLVYKRRQTASIFPRMILTNGFLPALEKFQDIVGSGRIHSKHTVGRRRPCWTWEASCRQAESVLLMLMPYLTIKKRQAEIAISSVKYRGIRGRHNPHREVLVSMQQAIKDINKGFLQ